MANEKLQQQLKDLGSKLQDSLPSTKDSLLKLLKQGSTCLSELEQSPSKPVLESMQPFIHAVVKPELLKHQDREVRLLVATCICEITRVTAPVPPYADDVLKDIFSLTVSTFSGLSDTASPLFGRRVVILETLAKYKSCLVMLDLDCHDLINEMFTTFLTVGRDEHPESVLTSMQTIMVLLLEESEDVQEDLLFILLSKLGPNKADVTVAARRLAMNVIVHCAGKLEPGLGQFLVSSMSGESRSPKCQIDHYEVIYDIYRCAPQMLSGVVPYLTGDLLADQLDTRLKAVKLVGGLFALPGSPIPESFQPIFLEFLKRLTDRVIEVRLSVLEHIKVCLLSDPVRSEAPQIIAALGDRLLDYDENVRKQVVAVVCDVACYAVTSIPVETVKLVAERLRDTSLLVKKYTMERLAEIYKNYCLNSTNGSMKSDAYDWIPGKILRCFYDKDFRSDTVESILCLSMFPSEFSARDKVKSWVRSFTGFDKIEVKAMEKILEQKQRLQQEMQKYLSFRQTYQESDAAEIQKKVASCFRLMSRCFTDPAKVEENFQILDQLKDANVWKILNTLLDPNTTSLQASSFRDGLLRILGEKHRLYEFLSLLSLKCSNLLFSKELSKEIILEAELQKSSGNAQLVVSCMSILVILARFCPLLLSGMEEDLIHILEDDNEIMKEGVLHVLAKAGGAIREQLGASSRSLDLMLERICLEGNRRQAKYAVHALASITKDDGLMSLSVLYKRLVDMLQEKSHLPAVLQSLGCIAQTATPVFETRETEIEEFIRKHILECSMTSEDQGQDSWNDRSELCSLKIFGVKTLVKSYLPVKEAHLRSGIDELIGCLKSILSFGEISRDIKSSSLDKVHLRLAAAKAVLRLSKHWDHKIPVDVFYLALGVSEGSYPQVKSHFLNKVHQYVKDRLLDPKYSCAFFDLGSQPHLSVEEKHNFFDIIQMCQQGKARQHATQGDQNVTALYPEYILAYLVHALANHSSFPNLEECKDVKAYEPIYRQLHLFLSSLMHGGSEDGKSDINVSKNKESASAIVSIFQSIKCSEDNIDPRKSKNLYVVCDLGLSITKQFAPEDVNLQDSCTPVLLPVTLYKLREIEGNDKAVDDSLTWLADESVLAHFQSLKLEATGNVTPVAADDDVMKDSETDCSEMPLGKIIKRLKAKEAKARREVKAECLPSGEKKESVIDILNVVREINSDNLGGSSKFESNNGHEYARKKRKTDSKLQKRKSMLDGSNNAPVPKRRRSSSTLGHKSSFPKVTSKKELPSESVESGEGLNSGSEDISMREGTNEPAESDLLASCIGKNSSSSSKRKGKRSFRDHKKGHKAKGHEKNDQKKSKNATETDNSPPTNDSKSAALKKRKRKSIPSMAKCTSKESETPTTELIGCKIKVWWPTDKKFYEGTVKSFDTEKKKHVVLYTDGDVEVLRLSKERWELVDKSLKSEKSPKASKGSRSNDALKADRKRKSSGVSTQKKKAVDMPPARRRRTPRKNVKRGQKKISQDQVSVESEGIPHSPDLDLMKSPSDAVHSEDEQTLSERRGSPSLEESGNQGGSDSKGKEEASAENISCASDKVAQENDSESEAVKDVSGTSHTAQESDEELVSSSDEKLQPADTKEESTEEADGELDESDSQPNTSAGGGSPSGSMDSEIPDDQPLSMWMRRIGKGAGLK